MNKLEKLSIDRKILKLLGVAECQLRDNPKLGLKYLKKANDLFPDSSLYEAINTAIMNLCLNYTEKLRKMTKFPESYYIRN